MVVGRVERGEVVVLELDLGPLGDAEAEARRRRPRSRAGSASAGARVPRGTGSPGSVTSTASAPQLGVELARLERSRSAACSRSSSPRTRFSSWPRAPRSSAGSAPSSRSASVSALERPSASTRASSSSAAVVARSSCSRPCRSRLAASSMDIPASMQGRGSSPAVPPCLRRVGASRFRPFGGVPSGSGGELRRTVRAGALSHGPAPCPDGARLLVSVGAGTAILPRYGEQQHRAVSPTSGSGRSTTAGAPGSTTTSRSTSCRARARPARSSSWAPAAGASRSSSRATATA